MYVVGTHYNHLGYVIQMSTHNICFHGELMKIILSSHIICFTDLPTNCIPSLPVDIIYMLTERLEIRDNEPASESL